MKPQDQTNRGSKLRTSDRLARSARNLFTALKTPSGPFPSGLAGCIHIAAVDGALMVLAIWLARRFGFKLGCGIYAAPTLDLLEYAVAVLAATLLPTFLIANRSQRRHILRYWMPALTAGILVRVLLLCTSINSLIVTALLLCLFLP